MKGLIERTREVERFPVVFEELCGYGFRRNLYGLRPAAIVACVVSLLGCVVGVLIASGETGDVQTAPFVVVAILGILELAFLRRFVASEWGEGCKHHLRQSSTRCNRKPLTSNVPTNRS